MKKIFRTMVIGMLIFTFISCENSTDSDTPLVKPDYGVAGDDNLKEILEYICTKNGVPAIGSLVVINGEIVDRQVAGTIKKGGSEEVASDSKWHTGSITKSMTSTLAGIFVENGQIEWNSTILEILPFTSTMIEEKYQNIELQELLTHTSGIGEIDLDVYYDSDDSIVEQRLDVAQTALNSQFDIERGEFSYSNTGYVIAAAMLEEIAGKSWEELLTEKLFIPLGMNNSGFMAPKDNGSPWGHSPMDGSPIDPESLISDNPAVLGPAGVVHLTLEDMSKYIKFHLDKGQTMNIMSPSIFEKLHTGIPEIGMDTGLLYAMGWNVLPDGSVMSHDGSNYRWLASLTINHIENIGIFYVINMAGPQIGEAYTEIGEYLLNRAEAYIE